MQKLLKELILCKIDAEYKRYQAKILSLSNIRIYELCYEIDCIVNFYEILLEKIPEMSEEELMRLVTEDNILCQMYDKWLSKDDSNYVELEKHVLDELDKLVAEKKENIFRSEEVVNGKEKYQIAS